MLSHDISACSRDVFLNTLSLFVLRLYSYCSSLSASFLDCLFLNDGYFCTCWYFLDTAFAFCEQEKQILIEPVFAHLHSTSSIAPVGPGDFLAHHAIVMVLVEVVHVIYQLGIRFI